MVISRGLEFSNLIFKTNKLRHACISGWTVWNIGTTPTSYPAAKKRVGLSTTSSRIDNGISAFVMETGVDRNAEK